MFLEMRDPAYQLPSKELDLILEEPTMLFHLREQLASGHKLENEVDWLFAQIAVFVSNVEDIEHIWMADRPENLDLELELLPVFFGPSSTGGLTRHLDAPGMLVNGNADDDISTPSEREVVDDPWRESDAGRRSLPFEKCRRSLR